VPHDGGRRRPAALSDLRTLACRVFDLIIAGDLQTRAVAHPLDFVCVPLARAPGFGVCAHIWRDGQAVPTIHSHSWHLYSEVVLGAIANEVFAVTECPGGDHELVRIDSTGSRDRIAPTGRAVLVEDTERTLHLPGSSYDLAAGVFHRSMPLSDGPTLTLVAATTLPGARDQIVAGRPADHERTIRREILPAEATLLLVTFFREVISDGLASCPVRWQEETPPSRSPAPIPPDGADNV
jgi:hypothetical protein